MDIACPTCATTYEIDDSSISEAGRKVRCAECATVWRIHRSGRTEILSAPPPPAPEPAAAPQLAEAPPLAPDVADMAATPELPVPSADLVEPSIEEIPATAGTATPARQGAEIVQGRKTRRIERMSAIRSLVHGPTLVLAGSAALLVGAWFLRDHVVRIAPQTAAVFDAVGAPVNLRGIEIRNMRSRMIDDNGVNLLVIDGDLVNLRTEQMSIPRLRFAVLGDKGQELFVWSAQADRSVLKPGETLNFRRRLAAPPSDGHDVAVRFLTASDITAGIR
jgi:predicted Zn finger-like uncharacterized protein